VSQSTSSRKNSFDISQAFENAAAPAIFYHSIRFKDDIRTKFTYPVNLFDGPRRRELFLVISFGRSRFRLNRHIIVVVLQACFGGIAHMFKGKLLRDRSFKFSAASKLIVFSIYNSGIFSDADSEFFVNLWGEGGPNWLVEEPKNIIKSRMSCGITFLTNLIENLLLS
jgi:hypothetical protein